MEWIKTAGLKNKDLPKSKVLVTNNITSLDAHGGMSHVWISHLFKEGKSNYYGYDESISMPISNVTHFLRPEPPKQS